MKKAIWTLPVAGFLVGTLFGTFALGDLVPGRGDDEARVVGLGPPPASDVPTATGSAPSPAIRAITAPVEMPETAPEGPSAADMADRLESALAAWHGAQTQIADLQSRLARVEQRLARGADAARSGSDADDRPRAPRTVDERREAMVSAGVAPSVADEIVWRDSQVELDRLSLRDQAVREGWIGTARYREELERITADSSPLREQIGDGAWDRYLYVTGADNRVRVAAVIPGSAAEAAGVQPGDLIESYAGARVFGYGELRDLTTEGEGGELIAVQVGRAGEPREVWVPRGPLGVRMEMTRSEPAP